VYLLLSDVSTWPSWNSGVQRIDIEGPFTAGTRASMFFPDSSSSPFTLTWVEPNVGDEDVTAIPDAGVTVRVRDELKPDHGGTQITYHCVVEGGPNDLCADIGQQVSADFPDVLAGLGATAQG